MSVAQSQEYLYPGDVYRIHIQGTMKSNVIDYCGELSALSLENGAVIRVSFVIDQDLLSNFVNHFQELNLQAGPINSMDKEDSTTVDSTEMP